MKQEYLHNKIGSEITYDDLSKELGISVEEIEYLYSLRSNPLSINKKVNEEDSLEIIDLIQNSDLSFTAISKKYSISNSTIGLINKGTRYHNNNLIYPLRDKQKIKEFQYKRK